MLNYIIRRLLLMIPTLIGVTAVVFFTMALSPGGVAGPQFTETGETNATVRKALREYYNKRYGLDKPVIIQYFNWLNRVSPIGTFTQAGEKPPASDFIPDRGVGFVVGENADGTVKRFGFKMPDLGRSMLKGRPVTDLYLEAVPITLLLNVLTTPLIYILSIFTGILAAKHRGKFFDVASGITFLFLSSIPENLVGVLLIGFLASVQYLHWFPAGGLHDLTADAMSFLPHWGTAGFERGYLLDMLWHLALPIFCLTYGGFAFLSKLTRASVLDNLYADFARTARAKGVTERVVLYRHVFRNSLISLITVAAGIIPGLIAGSIVIETIFSIPGMGKLGVEAVFARDRELILAGTLIGGVIGLLCRLASDLCYTIADPRVSYE